MTDPPTSPAPEPPARRVGRYVLGRVLGEGGMGVVHEAYDPDLDRTVAVKLVRPDLRSADPRRFVREAKAAAKVQHPNVVAVFDAGEDAGTLFLAMEYIDGRTASAVVGKKGRLPWPTATRLIAAACRGLAAIHAAGFVHRDLKPGNLMVDRAGRVRVTDFGLARPVADGTTQLTAADRLVGTPEYMSPEQCRGEPADARSDVYALGATYFALLAARPPFLGETAVQVMFAHCSAPVPDVRAFAPETPDAVAAVLGRALAKDPDDRYPTAAAFRAALDAALAGASADGPTDPAVPGEAGEPDPFAPTVPVPPVRVTRRRWLAIAGGAVGGAAGVVVVLATRGKGERPPATDPAAATAGTTPTAGPHPSGGGPTLDAVGGQVGGVTASADGRWLAVARSEPTSGRGGVLLFDRTGGDRPRELWSQPGFRGVAFSPDGRWLAAAENGYSRLRLWDLTAQAEGPAWPGFASSGGDFRAVAFDPAGGGLAAGFNPWGSGKRAVVHLWDAAGKKLRELPSGSAQVRAVGFSPDGATVAAAGIGEPAAVDVWDAAGGDAVRLPADPGGYGTAVAFARAAPVLAVADRRRVRVFRGAYRGEPVRVIALASDPVSVAVSPDGKLVAANVGPAVTVWDADTGAERASFPGELGPEYALAFAGPRVVVGGSQAKKVFEWPVG